MIFVLVFFANNSVYAVDTSDFAFRVFPDYLNNSRDRIGLKKFLDFIPPKRCRKFLLPNGQPEHPLDEYIDTLPVATRLEVLDDIFMIPVGSTKNNSARHQLHRELENMKSNSIEKIYLHYLLGGLYMESGLLNEFLRIGFGKKNEENDHIENCVIFVEAMKQFFQENYSYNIDALTPRMIHYWYRIFFKSSIFRINIAAQYAQGSNSNADDIFPSELVNLEQSCWMEIIKERYNNLILTGYENIDL